MIPNISLPLSSDERNRRQTDRLVRSQRTRPALASDTRPLSHLALGGHSPADADRAGDGLLPALRRAVSRRRRPGCGRRRRSAQTLAGIGLLQPRAESPRRGPAGRRTLRRAVSRRLCRRAVAQRRGRLYGGGRLLDRLRRAVRRGRRQCLPRAVTALRPRSGHRHRRGPQSVRRACRRTTRPASACTLQPGDHGFRRAAMHARPATTARCGTNVCRWQPEP